MTQDEMILTDEFCLHHHIEQSFLYNLNDIGIIQLITIEEKKYVPLDQIKDVEKYTKLHYDLDINIEGIETIHHLLHRLNELHYKVNQLNSQLKFYEND